MENANNDNNISSLQFIVPRRFVNEEQKKEINYSVVRKLYKIKMIIVIILFEVNCDNCSNNNYIKFYNK